MNAATALIALGFAGWVLNDQRADLRYWLSSTEPTDLGAPNDLHLDREAPGLYARIKGSPGTHVERFDRFGVHWELVGIPGTNVVVQRRDSAGNAPRIHNKEPPANPAEFVAEGRLTRDDEAPEVYRTAFAGFVQARNVEPANGHLYLLVDGEKPRTGARLPLIVAGLVVLIALNLRMLWRALRG